MADQNWRDAIALQADRFADEYLRGILSTLSGVEAEVRLMRERHPHLDNARLAERIVGDAVMRSGQLGALVAIPTLLPVLGGALLMGTIAADASFLLRVQLGMLLELSYLHDPDRGRAERELAAVELYARYASLDEIPTTPTPALAGHLARIAFKHVARRMLHHAGKRISHWWSWPMSLIISAKVNRDSTGELGEFAAMELANRNA